MSRFFLIHDKTANYLTTDRRSAQEEVIQQNYFRGRNDFSLLEVDENLDIKKGQEIADNYAKKASEGKG